MSTDKKTYSLKTSVTIVIVLVGIISAVSYFVAVSGRKPADTQTEKRWASELERAFLAFDGVRSATIDGSTNRIDFAEDKPLAVQKETALKAARTAAALRQQLKLDPKVTVLVSMKGKPQYELVYAEPQGVVQEKILEATVTPATNAPTSGVQAPP